MATGSRFDSKVVDVAALCETAKTAILNDIAAQAEAYAKRNIIQNDSVDTGFMANATYGITTKSNGVAPESQTLKDRQGNVVTRRSDGLDGTDKDTSAVGCGANYAIFVELTAPFIGPAGIQVEDDIPAIIRKHSLP